MRICPGSLFGAVHAFFISQRSSRQAALRQQLRHQPPKALPDLVCESAYYTKPDGVRRVKCVWNDAGKCREGDTMECD